MNTPLYPSTSLETKWTQDKSAQLSRKIRQIIWIIAAYKKEWIDTINRVAFDYTRAVEESGGIPIIIPCNIENIAPYLDIVDGIIFPGWWDIDPVLYGEDNTHSEDPIRENDEFLMKILKECINQKKKVLAICKWMQLLNVLQWGTLIQHLQNAPLHNQYELQYESVDTVNTISGSFLHQALWVEKSIPINSLHHQAVKDLWKDLRIVARSNLDGTVEAIEHTSLPVYGVQWHPECLKENRKLFEWFIAL